MTYDQRVGIALKIQGPLAIVAKKRQGVRTDITPKSEEGSGESAAQAAKQVKAKIPEKQLPKVRQYCAEIEQL